MRTLRGKGSRTFATARSSRSESRLFPTALQGDNTRGPGCAPPIFRLLYFSQCFLNFLPAYLATKFLEINVFLMAATPWRTHEVTRTGPYFFFPLSLHVWLVVGLEESVSHLVLESGFPAYSVCSSPGNILPSSGGIHPNPSPPSSP